MSEDFETLENYINRDTFFYCDPPYLITLGSYNDGKRGFNGWNEEHEIRLLNFLDRIDRANGRFMLSNVIDYNDKENIILKRWLARNPQYIVKKYNHTTGKSRLRNEIIVINYEV